MRAIPEPCEKPSARNILIGISGGIAAYKTATLVSQLVQQGHDVRVIMTENATRFITPLTLSTISRAPVMVEQFAHAENTNIAHISSAEWADLAVVAPATANILAKVAHGVCDDLLSTTLCTLGVGNHALCPVVLVPAMNTNMWQHPATQANILQLKQWGYDILEPKSGWLACGRQGVGRMAEPDEIVSYLQQQQYLETSCQVCDPSTQQT